MKSIKLRLHCWLIKQWHIGVNCSLLPMTMSVVKKISDSLSNCFSTSSLLWIHSGLLRTSLFSRISDASLHCWFAHSNTLLKASLPLLWSLGCQSLLLVNLHSLKVSLPLLWSLGCQSPLLVVATYDFFLLRNDTTTLLRQSGTARLVSFSSSHQLCLTLFSSF